jgi:uncharacterized protein (UPF0335 family)
MTNDSPKGVKRYRWHHDGMWCLSGTEVRTSLIAQWVDASDYDALAATVERLEREKAQIQRAVRGEYKDLCDKWAEECKTLRAQLSQSQERERALEAALRKYGKHAKGCDSERNYPPPDDRSLPCSCGLDADLTTPTGGGV